MSETMSTQEMMSKMLDNINGAHTANMHTDGSYEIKNCDVEAFLAELSRLWVFLHEAIEQLQAALDKARAGNYSGCVHTIENAVDREGCCTSCGEDLNYLALMQMELELAKKENGQLRKLPRNILQIQKLWASTINPDYKKMAESMITIAEQAPKAEMR